MSRVFFTDSVDTLFNRVRSLSQPCVGAVLMTIGAVSLTAQEAVEEPDPAAAEAPLMSRIRQLTFEGKRAGEGYFSADGTKMVFQSEREADNPFYQIYLLDLETGDTRKISNGVGKTTCAWIHPDGKRILFASTHEDAASAELQKQEFAERESNKARKYSWDYDAHYEIYAYDLETGEYSNLTNTEGYDAEGAYSPDGKQMVFASNRQAYDGSMSEEDQKAFKLDKKFPMEIYTAAADGSQVKRLTHADGYDGGPFFSADGKKITWRRFDRKGLTAEIYTMNADGSDQRAVTQLQAMSWAPFFHPSGEYLIFGTNVHGFDNFELYLVDVLGEKEPVRVTHTPGFDGLPVFSPDGKTLSWTSNRTAEKTSQIFLASWDHEAARRLLSESGAAKPASASQDEAPAESTSAPKPEGSEFASEPAIVEQDIRNHVAYLASEALEGRLTGTKGEQLATQHVADWFERLGLKPGGDDGTYFEEFAFTAGVSVGKNNRLTLVEKGTTREAEVEKDWRPISFSRNGELADTGVVFAGYGIELADDQGGSTYSSYFHLDVKGKWVMVFRFQPENAPKEQKQMMQRFAGLRHKAALARRKFAAGIIFVSGPESQANEELVPMQFDASLADSGIPAISISTETAARWLAQAGKDLAEVQKSLDSGEQVQGFDLPDLRLTATIDVEQEKRVGRNVIGILESGKGGHHPPPAVMMGAHVDHLGPQAGAGSLARDDEKQQVHYGADDNASGVAGMLEVAEYLADLKVRGEIELARDVVFAAWSGEELGLLGSSHFVRHLAKNTMGDENAPLGFLISSYLNLDMIGRLSGNLVLQGIGSSDGWGSIIEKRNAPVGLPITIQRDAYLPTDATSFYLREVPILSAFTGAHEDYHSPRDTPDKLNYEGIRDISRFMGLVARGLATDPAAPKYVKVDPPKNRGGRGFRVYLGTVPDYSQGDIKGVKLSGVAEKGPTAKAGVKGGDVIVGLGGREILNIYDYTEAMADLTVGEETDITIERNGEKHTFKLVPGSRD